MKKEEFARLMEGLNSRVDSCKRYLDTVNTTEDLAKLSIVAARSLRDWAREEQGKMDQVAKSELYHILGMGNLTVVQTMEFIAKVKTYLSFRSTIRTIAAHLSSIDNLPNIPVHATYDLHVLADLTLHSGPIEREAAREEEEGIEVKSEPPFLLRGKTIQVQIDQLPNFVAYLSTACALPVSDVKKLKAAIDKGGAFFGIQWSAGTLDGTCSGIVTSEPILSKLSTLSRA